MAATANGSTNWSTMAAEVMCIDTRILTLLAFGQVPVSAARQDLVRDLSCLVSPEAFSPQESVIIVAMVVFGGIGHIPGVIFAAIILTALPEVLRYIVGPVQTMTDGRLDAGCFAHRSSHSP